MESETGWIWVDTPKKRQEAGRDIASSPWIALDTEYDSFRYFRDKLCLIQVKTPSMTYLVDPLDGTPPEYLTKPFASREVLKVSTPATTTSASSTGISVYLPERLRHVPGSHTP